MFPNSYTLRLYMDIPFGPTYPDLTSIQPTFTIALICKRTQNLIKPGLTRSYNMLNEMEIISFEALKSLGQNDWMALLYSRSSINFSLPPHPK